MRGDALDFKALRHAREPQVLAAILLTAQALRRHAGSTRASRSGLRRVRFGLGHLADGQYELGKLLRPIFCRTNGPVPAARRFGGEDARKRPATSEVGKDKTKLKRPGPICGAGKFTFKLQSAESGCSMQIMPSVTRMKVRVGKHAGSGLAPTPCGRIPMPLAVATTTNTTTTTTTGR